MSSESEHGKKDPRPNDESMDVRSRLVALSGEAPSEEKPSRGVWLTKEMEALGLELDREPTEEEIKKQLRLPSKDQQESFRDPIVTWQPVEPGHDVTPTYTREYLPEDEEWTPPTPPRDVFVIHDKLPMVRTVAETYKSKEPAGYNVPASGPSGDTGKQTSFFKNKDMALAGSRDDQEELVVYDAACLIRVQRRDLQMAKDKQMRENRSPPPFRSDRGGRGGGRGRGRGGERPGGSPHNQRNSNYERLGDRRRDRSRSSSRASNRTDHRDNSYSRHSRSEMPREERSRGSDRDDRADRPGYRSRSPRQTTSYSSRNEGRPSYGSDRDRDRSRYSSDSSRDRRGYGDGGYRSSGEASMPRGREPSASSSRSSTTRQPQSFREYKEMKEKGLM